jgi:hypothetical protein
MNNKLTTPKAILIGSFMIAGTILYTSGNISNPIIGTALAEKFNFGAIDRDLFRKGFRSIEVALRGISACKN